MRKPMSLEHRLKLTKNHVQLVNEMQLEYMMPYFIQENVLTFDMAEDIRSANKSYAMNQKLLKMLPHRGEAAYHTLIAALKFGSGQLHLVELMENTEVLIKDMAELDDEMNGKSRRCSCNSSSSFYEDDDEEPRTRPSTTLRTKSTLEVSAPARKAKPIRKPRRKQQHIEQLPDIAHLLPYVVPHINKRWPQLAVALGLTEQDMEDIVVRPHEKQSRYTNLILKMWLDKDKVKATKGKLVQALTDIRAKKALEAIAIYEVPKFKVKPRRKIATNNMVPVITEPDELPSIAPIAKRVESSYLQKISNIRRSGHLAIRCNVEKVSANNTGGCTDHSQKVFLEIADKITNSMVQQGEPALQILNAVERLQGIVFHKVYKGSVILETQVMHLMALDKLMDLYTSSELTSIIEGVFVTEELLSQHSVSEVRLMVQILPSDYEECREELMALVSEEAISDSEFDSSAPSDQGELCGSEDDSEEMEESSLIGRCCQIIQDTRHQLSSCLTQFDTEISELLMTLQLVHPPDVTKISTMDDMSKFRGYVLAHPPQILSTASIDHFLDIHQQFIDKVTSLRYQISSALFVAKTNEEETTSVYSLVESCMNNITGVQRMLQPSYDFSSLTHPHTKLMTTMETLCYRGLLACHYVILDRLAVAQTTLSR